MFRKIFLASILAPGVLLAAGGDNTSAPKPSETTKECKGGKVWDDKAEKCVNPQNGALDDDTLYSAVREFAYAGQLEHAQTALAAMSNQTEDRVLTYWGFTHRKLGDVYKGMVYYERAIAQNPSNILARSYMGQALVELGNLSAAREQLEEIRLHDGVGTWAEIALAEAISTGKTYSY